MSGTLGASSPSTICRSVRHRPHTLTLTRTSSSCGSGIGTSNNPTGLVSIAAGRGSTIAFIVPVIALTLDIFPADEERMIVATEFQEITVDDLPLRLFVAAPKTEAARKFPGIIFYSDIFQLTPPMLRACVRLAGYGFVVAAPEIYHRLETPGTVIAFDDAGRRRGLEDANKTQVSEFD